MTQTAQTASAPAERRTPRAATPRRSRTRSHTQRRRAVRAAEPAMTLQRFWDEHAVKAGMLAFYAWFAVANWSKLGALLH